MGIAKKNRRKLVFKNQYYYWWVKDEFDGDGGMLSINVVSENKSFLIKYYVIQNQSVDRYITVIGKTFLGIERKTGNSLKFICPDFIPNVTHAGISSKDVISILEWCYDTTKDLILAKL